MNFFRFISILVLAISLSFTTTVSAHGDEHDEEAEHQHAEAAKGPHGGRLLTQDDFALEVTIYETEVEPELRLYLYQNGEPIKTPELKLQVTLQRLGEPAELINFSPELDYWLGDTVIREPHSFEVEINASYQGKNFEWHYDSFEGRTELSARSVQKAGIELEQTQPGQIHTQLHLFGVVAPVPEQQYQVGAPYAGVLQQLAVKVGDKVTKGQLLATVQNPVSLKNYNVFAPASGEVTAKYVSVGAKVSEQSIVEISDFSSVYIEMSAFPSDTEQLKLGQEFLVKDLHGHQSAVSQISYIAPQMTGGHIARARGVLANPNGHWRPGMH
ncbi:MAG TPA: efflux RND transporter periplasmic adaptor subunit, partial [Rheinheimera sp.]|uniref:efflux RND transporter periplasmic adaptor subunit n=1 Tax=Rheinheimera sp. TaxID=1869214 RepID=UPI002B4A4A28